MSKKSFFDLFPVPEYLSFPTIGLDLCGHSIKFIELINEKGKLRTGRYAKRSLPPIPPPPASPQKDLDDSISDVISKMNRDFGLKYAHISLPEEHSYFLKF